MGGVEPFTEAAWKWRVDVLTQKPAERTAAVTYIEMDKGSKEEYTLLRDLAQPFKSRLADRILAHMQLLHDSFPGEQVDRYVHSLQTATRAHRHGADEETVVAALLHDIGDMLAQDNHGELAAAVLRPYVSSATAWVVAKHGIFQGYYYFHHFGMNRNQREEFRGHPAYEKAIRFSTQITRRCRSRCSSRWRGESSLVSPGDLTRRSESRAGLPTGRGVESPARVRPGRGA